MKALIYTWLILGIAFLAYDYFAAPRSKRIVFERGPDLIKTPEPKTPRVIDERAPATPMQSSSPSNVADAFVPPAIESLETLTKNWTAIPPSAFPRSVKLTKEIDFKMSAGSSRMAPGSVVTALSCENGTVALAPTPTSKARGFARVDDTDLKVQFVEPYQKWVAWRTENLREQWQKTKLARADSAPRGGPIGAVEESGKPVRSTDGSYPILLASMSAGEVTDITPKKVKHIGQPQLITTEGRPTWVIDVHYDTVVFCGPIEAHAQAHIRDGKVVRWVYPGSGEPVP